MPGGQWTVNGGWQPVTCGWCAVNCARREEPAEAAGSLGADEWRQWAVEGVGDGADEFGFVGRDDAVGTDHAGTGGEEHAAVGFGGGGEGVERGGNGVESAVGGGRELEGVHDAGEIGGAGLEGAEGLLVGVGRRAGAGGEEDRDGTGELGDGGADEGTLQSRDRGDVARLEVAREGFEEGELEEVDLAVVLGQRAGGGEE